ncbi:MAG: hypothetical protein QOD30_246 [Actinomycetota bacterium]|nr:hypothetical protein [Actinomycetota bacterium]
MRSCRRRFLRFYPDGFRDEDYVELERSYKWDAHRRWKETLGRDAMASLLDAGRFEDLATSAVKIESRTNLLFSFEKMAMRDAIREPAGAKAFAIGLHDWLHGPGSERARFERWIDALDALPRRQTRVVTWPVATVFGFLARPRVHLYLKPTVTRTAAEACGWELAYTSRPCWATYADLLRIGRQLHGELADLGPRDMIDIQSYIWVQGSAEYD